MYNFNFGMDNGFGPYAYHTTELDNIVDNIVSNYRITGETSFSINVPEDITPSDLDYIRNEVKRRI